MPRGPDRRDKEGLTWRQRRLLAEMARTPNIGKACENVDISRRTLRRWLREDENFRRAYDKQFELSAELLVKLMAPAQEEAVSKMMEALNAEETQVIRVQCPACGTKFESAVKVMDWKTRLNAADRILKAKGIMTDKREVKVSGEIEHLHLDAADKIQLLRWQAGYEVPPHVEQKFQEMVRKGLLPPREEKQDEVIEGEIVEEG